MTDSDRAIEILGKTHDGRDLYQSPENIERWGRNGDGWQLSLLQSAVNRELNDFGRALFDALHRQVLAGDYKYPYEEFKEKFCHQIPTKKEDSK